MAHGPEDIQTMAMDSSLRLLQAAGISTVALAVIVLTGIAVITGFKDSGQINNTTAQLFITGLSVFGTFMAVIILALIGKVIVGFFVKGN